MQFCFYVYDAETGEFPQVLHCEVTGLDNEALARKGDIAELVRRCALPTYAVLGHISFDIAYDGDKPTYMVRKAPRKGVFPVNTGYLHLQSGTVPMETRISFRSPFWQDLAELAYNKGWNWLTEWIAGPEKQWGDMVR
jgi:hypothetical protein